jgi:hypothetical protein
LCGWRSKTSACGASLALARQTGHEMTDLEMKRIAAETHKFVAEQQKLGAERGSTGFIALFSMRQSDRRLPRPLSSTAYSTPRHGDQMIARFARQRCEDRATIMPLTRGVTTTAKSSFGANSRRVAAITTWPGSPYQAPSRY